MEGVFEEFLKMGGHPYVVERDGEVIANISGHHTKDKTSGRLCIGVRPDSGVMKGDYLICNAGKRHLVVDTYTLLMAGFPHKTLVFYSTT